MHYGENPKCLFWGFLMWKASFLVNLGTRKTNLALVFGFDCTIERKNRSNVRKSRNVRNFVFEVFSCEKHLFWSIWARETRIWHWFLDSTAPEVAKIQPQLHLGNARNTSKILVLATASGRTWPCSKFSFYPLRISSSDFYRFGRFSVSGDNLARRVRW